MSKRALIACGIVLLSMAASASAQVAGGWYRVAGPRSTRYEPVHAGSLTSREFSPPAPRGDLRGDIESNARARREASPYREGVRGPRGFAR
jgi:hypothetical protein